jgi:hypothetical protein
VPCGLKGDAFKEALCKFVPANEAATSCMYKYHCHYPRVKCRYKKSAGEVNGKINQINKRKNIIKHHTKHRKMEKDLKINNYDINDFVCEICIQAFVSRISLNSHNSRKHRKEENSL